jgi:hypothetical protein
MTSIGNFGRPAAELRPSASPVEKTCEPFVRNSPGCRGKRRRYSLDPIYEDARENGNTVNWYGLTGSLSHLALRLQEGTPSEPDDVRDDVCQNVHQGKMLDLFFIMGKINLCGISLCCSLFWRKGFESHTRENRLLR